MPFTASKLPKLFFTSLTSMMLGMFRRPTKLVPVRASHALSKWYPNVGLYGAPRRT